MDRLVGQGNFAMRVAGRTGSDEIGLLNRAFNRMTAQIEQQTGDLVAANRQLENRRAFIEAVLESITAGIISTDREGRVLLMNSSAQTLLTSRAGPTPVGQALAQGLDAVGGPELRLLFTPFAIVLGVHGDGLEAVKALLQK